MNKTSEKCTKIEGYNALFNSRESKGWGGVALFLKLGITYIPRPDISLFFEGVFESVFAEVLDKGRRFIVGSIYRPPNSNMTAFLQYLGEVTVKLKDKPSYIMGDFNLDLLKSQDNSPSSEFLDDLSSVGFHPLISLPSRITSHTASIIDNIFTNDFCGHMTSGFIVTPLSDHLPTFAIFHQRKQYHDKAPRLVTKRDLGSKNKAKFREWVRNWGPSVSLNANTIEEDASVFFQHLKQGYDACFPPKQVRLKRIDIEKPWLHNEEMLSKLKERNRLHASTLKNPLNADSHQERLKHLGRKINSLRRKLKKTYFSQKLEQAGKNTKLAWRAIHSFIGKPGKEENNCSSFFKDGDTITGDFNIAESFCDFFSNIASNLASNLPIPSSGSYIDYLNPQPEESAFFAPTTPQEIELLCKGLDSSKSAGYDGLAPGVLSSLSDEFSFPLSKLINVCLEVGHFPDFLKI